MYQNNLKAKIRLNLSNMFGWHTKRKIVVIESDDWGSIRTSSKEAWRRMKDGGLNVDSSHYNLADSLESNEDLEILFSVLSEFKDSNDRTPVFTPICNMGNPDFQKVEENDFREYFCQPLDQTILEYPAHDRLLTLWKMGISNRLFVPQLHGREHVNVMRFMKLLQSNDQGFRLAFNNRSVGASTYKGKAYPNYLGALRPETKEEIADLHKYLLEAGTLFESYCEYKPKVFVAPNAEEPKELETTLNKIGIKYINRAKIRRYPMGDGEYKTEYNWIGKRNEIGQLYLFRNCFFEPVCFGESDKVYITDWVDNCLKEIEIAFKWGKPAIISSHRVNYVGYLSPENRDIGLSALRRLLKQIINKWPEIEFMTSEELGDLIAESKR